MEGSRMRQPRLCGVDREEDASGATGDRLRP